MEGTDWEGSGEIGVHCAGVVSCKDSKTVDVVRGTYFLSWLELINEVACGNDGLLVTVGGGNMLSHAMEVSLVGGWTVLKVFGNECSCEPGNCL